MLGAVYPKKDWRGVRGERALMMDAMGLKAIDKFSGNHGLFLGGENRHSRKATVILDIWRDGRI
jgi:hypothetical protein